MRLHRGDHVQVKPSPDVDPYLWDHEGVVMDVDDAHHVIVELDTGEDCSLMPDQLVLRQTPQDPGKSPFDLRPDPRDDVL